MKSLSSVACLALPFCSLLSACAQLPLFHPGNSEAVARPYNGEVSGSVPDQIVTPRDELRSSLLAFLASASRDESGFVLDPNTGNRIRVVAGRAYYAASGRTCRKYQVQNGGAAANLVSGVACKDPTSGWMTSRLRVNPQMLENGGNIPR